jgi:hypothetical protein
VKKNMTIKMLGLIVVSLLVLKCDGYVLNSPILVQVIDFLAVGALLFSCFWIFLMKTPFGQQLKQELLDPIIKPSGSETKVWDPETGAPRFPTVSDRNKSSKATAQKRHYLVIVVGVFVVFVIVSLMLTTSDGGQLVSSIWVDIRNVLVMLLVLVALIGIAYGVFYFVRWRHRNQFTKEDKDDDFWNT